MAENTQLTHGNDVARLRADIEQTRAAMGDTLNAIQERLSPDRLKAQARESIREATIGRVEKMARKAGDKAGNTGRDLLEVARDNPVPLALIGIGAGWLLYNSRKRSARPGPDHDAPAIGYESAYTGDGAYTRPHDNGIKARAEQVAHTVSEKVGEMRDAVASKASDTAQHIGQVAAGITHSVSDGVQRAEGSAESAAQNARYKYEETPWVGAAVAIALGAAAGLAIPATRREQELLGDKRDELLDRAREMGRQKLESVRRVAEGVIEETREAAREYAREEGLTSTTPTRSGDTGLGL